MSDNHGNIDNRDAIEAALSDFLDPVVAMLLRNGVTYREFVQFSKQVFVAVAVRDFGIRGRPTNTSRVSALTGIDRKEVKAIRDLLAGEDSFRELRISQDKMSRVIRGWHEDSDFLDANNQPQAIALDGDALSFKELTRRFGGGLPMNVVLKELMNAECVEVGDDGLLHALKPYYSPSGANYQGLMRAGTVVNDVANALLHNLYVAPQKTRELPRFERRALTDIADKDVKAFKSMLDKEGQLFLEHLAKWLQAHQPAADYNGPKTRVGIGVYGIERSTEDDV